MPRKNPPTGTDADINLVSLLPILTNEDKAREFMEAKRWPNGPFCPHCGCASVYRITAKEGSKKPARPGLCKCKACRKQFTVRVGTIFEDSKLPIHIWLYAIHVMCAAKAGISSHELGRLLKITQKSAWFVCHRIREAMTMEPMAGMLKGTVECDETYMGARKPRIKGSSMRGSGTVKKPVLALVERDGKAVAFPIGTPTSAVLQGSVRKLVDKSSTIMTDDHRCYIGIGKDFEGGHRTVNHGRKEYVRYDKVGNRIVTTTTNTVEGFFARVKRSHYGIHHHMSVKHLHRYINEACFRWNSRKVSDGSRMVEAIKGAEGKRLMYREPSNQIGNGDSQT